MPYKRKYQKTKKTYKKKWMAKGKSKDSFKRRKWGDKALPKSKLFTSIPGAQSDVFRVKLKYNLRVPGFATQLLANDGATDTVYRAFMGVRGNDPRDPGIGTDIKNAAFLNYLSTFYRRMTCGYSTIKVTARPTATSNVVGWFAVYPIKYGTDGDIFTPADGQLEDFQKYAEHKVLPYCQMKTFSAGQGNTVSMKFKNSMSTAKMFGRPYDPSLDDTTTGSTTPVPSIYNTWMWFIEGNTDQVSSLNYTLDVEVTYYVTFKERIVSPIYPE